MLFLCVITALCSLTHVGLYDLCLSSDLTWLDKCIDLDMFLVISLIWLGRHFDIYRCCIVTLICMDQCNNPYIYLSTFICLHQPHVAGQV
jgi:hypothetical protein